MCTFVQNKLFTMSVELVTASEAIRLLNVTPARFIKLQDLGCFCPVVSGGRWILYDAASLVKELSRGNRPKKFPLTEYATIKQAMDILGVCRATFYNRVKAGKITLHKYKDLSFVLRKDLYANDDLF